MKGSIDEAYAVVEITDTVVLFAKLGGSQETSQI